MTSQEYIAEIEEQAERFQKQIDLRDKLILNLLAVSETDCEACALEGVCAGGAKYETCAAGLLAALQNNDKNY